MDTWLYAIDLAELRRRKKRQVMVGDEAVALFLVGEEVFALQDICIHKQRRLSNGVLLRGKVICPGHQWAFDPATGWNEENQRCQPTYDIRVCDGKVYVNPAKRVRASAPA